MLLEEFFDSGLRMILDPADMKASRLEQIHGENHVVGCSLSNPKKA